MHNLKKNPVILYKNVFNNKKMFRAKYQLVQYEGFIFFTKYFL